MGLAELGAFGQPSEARGTLGLGGGQNAYKLEPTARARHGSCTAATRLRIPVQRSTGATALPREYLKDLLGADRIR